MRSPLLPLLAALLLPLSAEAEPVEVAVARDGTLHRKSETVLDRKAGVLRHRKKEYPLDEFYLVEGPKGALLWTPDYASRMRGYEFLARAQIVEAAADLLDDAIRARLPDVSRALFELLQDQGYDGRKLARLEKKLTKLESRPGKPSPKAEGVRARYGRLRTMHTDLLLTRTLLELGVDEKLGLRMLRDLLAVDPGNTRANAEVAKRAPKEFPLGDARAWLDWHLEVERHGAKLAGNDTFNMRQARKYWRKDLHGIEVGPVLVITPVRDARTLGRMLGCCRITVEILESIFAGYPKRRRKFDPLKIFLYESRDEYKKESTAFKPREDPKFLEWSAGHYSPDEGISRLFWMKERDAESRIVGTAVHELTHHWLADANPAYNRAEGRRSARSPGFWIVEGIAEFLEEGVYDLDRGRWSLFDRRAASLDTVHALAAKGQLLPWEKFYAASGIDFWALPTDRNIVVRRRWILGAEEVSAMRLWYVQAAATCHFLYHAAGGKYRKALGAYILHHYTGKREMMDTNKAFGLSPKELGRRVVAYAGKVAEGWEPEVRTRKKGKKGGN